MGVAKERVHRIHRDPLLLSSWRIGKLFPLCQKAQIPNSLHWSRRIGQHQAKSKNGSLTDPEQKGVTGLTMPRHAAALIDEIVMSAWVRLPCPGAGEGSPGVLGEIDRALALIGAAHWTENFSTGARPRDRRQSASIEWQLWGISVRAEREERTTP